MTFDAPSNTKHAAHTKCVEQHSICRHRQRQDPTGQKAYFEQNDPDPLPSDGVSVYRGWCGRPARPSRRPAGRPVREAWMREYSILPLDATVRAVGRVARRNRRVACATHGKHIPNGRENSQTRLSHWLQRLVSLSDGGRCSLSHPMGEGRGG